MTMPTEAKVFVAGSRKLTRLNVEIRKRIDNIVASKLDVLIGDANGMDKAVQQYLHKLHYAKVTVFCMEGHCRNNVGDWPRREVSASGAQYGTYEYFSTKDRAMAREADFGLMLWDGHSRGTLRNIEDLVQRGRPVVAYVAPRKMFLTLKDHAQLSDIVAGPSSGVARKSSTEHGSAEFDRENRSTVIF